MKNIKLWQRVLLMLALLAATGYATCHAYDFSSNGIYYNINNTTGTVEVTCASDTYNSYSGHVVIPSHVANGTTVYDVTAVGDNAFRNSAGLTSVTLGDNIVSLGKRAFMGCSSLTTITITPAVTAVGDYAFNGCTSLGDVYFDNDTPLEVGTGAFMGCSALEKVDWVSSDELEGRGGLTSLGTNAFARCLSLPNIMLPGNVQHLGITIFEGCSNLNSITVMKETPLLLQGDPFSLDASKVTIKVPSSGTAGATAALYENANGWKKYSIEELPYTFIDSNGYQYLKTSSNSVSLTGKSIQGNEVVVRNSVTGYNSDRYYVTSIGDMAFKATWLKRLDTSNALKLNRLGVECFAQCKQLNNVVLVEGISDMGEKAFAGCSSLATVQLPSTLRDLPRMAFYGCTSLSQVDLLHGVSTIGEATFGNCPSLVSIMLPRSVTIVDFDAFEGSSSLQEIAVDALNGIYASVEGVLFERQISDGYQEGILDKMSKLVIYPIAKPDANFYIPCGTQELGENAMKGVMYLKRLAIPETVVVFGDNCFEDASIETINYRNSNPSNDSTSGLTASFKSATKLQVPTAAAGAYQSLAAWQGFKSIEERNDVEILGNFAYDWNRRHQVTLVDVLPAAVNSSGTLTIPNSIELSGCNYYVTEMSSTSTSHVTQLVKNLNISCDSLSAIGMAGNINPLSSLAALQGFTVSSQNPFLKINDGVLYNNKETILYFYPRYKAAQSFTLPSMVDTIMPQAAAWNNNLKVVNFNNKLSFIGAEAFKGCAALTTVGKAKTVFEIGVRAFAGCSSLTTFTGGELLGEIGAEAFVNCSQLLQFPLCHGRVMHIGDRAFKGCSSLRGVVFSNTLRSLGDEAFENCSLLGKVFFTSEVENFGAKVFKGCSSLSEMWLCNTTAPQVDNSFFENVSSVSLFVPVEALGLYGSASVWGSAKSIKGGSYLKNGVDVNDDNMTNAADITLIYSYFLGDLASDYDGNFDVNQDGTVTAYDITLIYDYILTGVDISTAYTFRGVTVGYIKNTMSLNDSPQVLRAVKNSTGQTLSSGFQGYVDNPAVAGITPGYTQGMQTVELAPLAPGYFTLVLIASDGVNSYYRAYPSVVNP